jgi:Ca-activated chloride channel family protein
MQLHLFCVIMKTILAFFLIFTSMHVRVFAHTEPPQKALNEYVEFLNQSTKTLTERFKMLSSFQSDVNLYRKKPEFSLRLPSSGPLEEFYYQKALTGNGLPSAEKQQLNAGANAIWDLLNKIDLTGKALETYVRLKNYQTDQLQESDLRILEMQRLFAQFRKEKDGLYLQIQQIYRRHQPYSASDPYQNKEKEMTDVLINQQHLLDSLPYYLDDEKRFDWPVERIQQSMLDDEKLLTNLGKPNAKIAYPASDAIISFKTALRTLQTIKSQAIDEHNFAASQNSKHGNQVYLSLLNQYNNDLLANYKSFIDFSQSAKRMLYYPAMSPVITIEPIEAGAKTTSKTAPFRDKPFQPFTVKKVTSPASPALLRTLNDHIDFINESLRQMHLLQVLLRNYQSSAEFYRDPLRARSRANLSYSHDDFKVPLSAYQLLLNASTSLPQPYKTAINIQAEVLLNVLKEMDGLSIELISYTTEKQYLLDHLQRSDAILDRYETLFNVFDLKKERLYEDVRRIHESYPNATPTSSWYIAGSALLKTMDDDHELLFGVKEYLKSEADQIPATEKTDADARQLIVDEYQNMKGLQRYGRSNGLCPYSPYEDLSGNSTRFAEKVRKVKMPSGSPTHPYESFYYFYNNELVYQYNKFTELAKSGLLKTVSQPDVFLFRRLSPSLPLTPPIIKKENSKTEENIISRPIVTGSEPDGNLKKEIAKTNPGETPARTKQLRDTVYVERLRVDTVFVERNAEHQEITRSLDGFAPNNMVLLLDVSASMESPFKLPLLKRSVKSLLKLLRPEDQIAIVLYSGKARVVLKPTSGSRAAEIGRMIDLLQSSGDTDGNDGLRLAYKVANKDYIRGGNNRIVLATDGEFPVSDEVMQMIGENARQDVYLTVLTFGRNQLTGKKLKKLSQLGQGTYAHVTEESADLQLIVEAQAKKQGAK